jgi:hypothetical protein
LQPGGRERPIARAGLGRSLSGTEPGVAGFVDGLGAVGDLELGEDVRHVVADGLGAEVQLADDVGVAAALGEQGQYFAFTFGQLGNAAGCRGAVPVR